MARTKADLDRAQRHVDDGAKRIEKQRAMLAERRRQNFPVEEAERTLASAVELLGEMQRHRDEIAQDVGASGGHSLPLEMGPSVLAACVAQTLNESDPTFLPRLVKRLRAAHAELSNDPVASRHSLEEIAWTCELLTGVSFSDPAGQVFLGGEPPKKSRR
jgi:hypothetical protein